MDDDAFNQFGYEEDFIPEELYEDPPIDEDAEFYLAQADTGNGTGGNRAEPENAGVAPDLAEHITPAAQAELRQRKRAERENVPLGEHPMDWFLRAEMDTVSDKKKRKLESDQASLRLADRITQERLRRLEAFDGLLNGIQRRPLGFLRTPEPGTDAVRMCDPDCVDSGFIALRPKETQDRSRQKSRILKAIDVSIREAAPPRRVVTPPAVTQSLSSAPDTTVNNTSTLLAGVDLKQFGLNDSDLMLLDDDEPDEEYDCPLACTAPERASARTAPAPEPSRQVPQSGELWASKYEAKTFLDLLTEDSQNKVVLAWLKLWNPYVFRRRANVEGLVEEYYAQALEVEDKAERLPRLKSLLIHGPSGCGKSSLAKVCALQAGYSPTVVDLSDSVSAADLRAVLFNRSGNRSIDGFLQSKTAKGPDKPCCFVVEGLDGASSELVKLVTEFVAGPRTKQKVWTRRPLIASCNNAFAPALKALRLASVVVKVDGMNKERSVKRLEKVCQLEGLPLKRYALLQLLSQCSGDMRLCLNNLQFYSASAGDSQELHAQSRIVEFSIFDALDAILTTTYHLDSRGHLKPPKERAAAVARTVGRRDDVDRVYLAVFHNAPLVLRLKVFQRLKLCQALVFHDQVSRYVQQSQNWSLKGYSNSVAKQIHFSVASAVSKRQNYNLGFMAFPERRRENADVLNSVELAQSPGARVNRSTLLLTVLPAICSMLQLSFKATSVQMLSKTEQDLLNKLADIMASYGLNFVQKFDNSLTTMALDPPVEQLCSFLYAGKPASISLSAHMKKTIAQRLALKRIRGEEESAEPVPQAKKPLSLALHDQVARMLNRGQHYSEDGPSPISRALLHYSQGTSQAIRRNLRNGGFMPFHVLHQQ